MKTAMDASPATVQGGKRMSEPTMKQVEYAKYLAKRVGEPLPTEFTKSAYSEFIDKWKPVVKHEDDGMNEPNAWQMQYS